MATDDFNRSDENPIVGDWTSSPGSWGDLDLTSNAVRPASTGTDSAARYNAGTWDDDQSSEIQLLATSQASTGTFHGAAVRMAAGGNTYVSYYEADPNSVSYYRVTGALSFTKLGSNVAWGTLGASDTLTLDVSGTTLDALKNSTSLASTRTDSTYTSGNPGVAMFFNSTLSDCQLDDWVGTGEAVGGLSIPVAMGSYRRHNQPWGH